MRKTVMGFWWSPTMEGTPALLVTAAFFTLGGLMGYLWVFRLIGNDNGILLGYLERFLSAVGSDGLSIPMLSGVLWRILRWPLLAFFLGFTALGLIGLPIVAGLRGFFLAFSVSALSLAYGRSGLGLAFLLLGLPGLVTVPAFFLLCTQSFSASWALAGRSSGQSWRELPYDRDYFFRMGFCGILLCVGVLLERYLVPLLLAGLATALIQ